MPVAYCCGFVRETTILQAIFAQNIAAQEIVDVAAPVGGSAEGIDTALHNLDRVGIAQPAEFSQIVAVERTNQPSLAGSEQ